MNILDSIRVGGIRCVFSSEPEATIHRVLELREFKSDQSRIVRCGVAISGSVSAMIDGVIDTLAQAAIDVWPDWYGQAEAFAECDEASLQTVIDRIATSHLSRQKRSILPSWLRLAIKMVRADRPPIVADFAPALQLQQLAFAIAEAELVLMVHAIGEAESTGLMSLSRSLEWFSQQVPARIVAVLPSSWAGWPELEGITWDSLTVEEAEDATPRRTSTESVFDEPPVMVSPIRGRPHPNSPGEQLMASRLRFDPLLRSLFQYNMPVETVRGSRYLVDLIWPEGKIVVEIDGYRAHSSRFDFANDRHRDYELLLSGFLVLRLTHENVMRDVELEIDKIRDLVKFRMALQVRKT